MKIVSLDRKRTWLDQEREPANGENLIIRNKREISNIYFKIQEIADRFHVSNCVLYQEIYSGNLTAIRIKGRWRVSQEALEEYINRPSQKRMR